MIATVRMVRRGDAKAAISRVKAALAGPSTVKVGFPSGVGGDLVMRAVWNEFGTAGGASGGGWGGPVPERPFMRNAMKDGRTTFGRITKADGRKILRGEMVMTTSLSRLGLSGQRAIQESIGANTPPPLSLVTIEMKGSTATLIDTGEMRQRVTWKIGD